MVQSSYDVVVVGAGHTGLALATLLVQGGYRVAVVERELSAGGMIRTDEAMGTGIVHHPHAVLLGFADVMPLRRELAAVGLETVTPASQHALVFRDGRPAVTIWRRDHLARTHASLSVYSRSDADLLVDLLQRADGMTLAMRRLLTRPPTTASIADHLAAVGRVYRGLRPPVDGRMSAADLITARFRTPEVRALLLLLTAELGSDPSVPGSAAGFLGSVLWQLGRRAVPRSGMGAVARAYRRAAETAGAELLLGHAVTGLSRRGANVDGVVVGGERVLRARHVVSTLGEAETDELLGAAHRHPFDTPLTTTVRTHLLLREPLRLRSETQDDAPAVQTFFGADDPVAVLERLADVRRGAFPAPGGVLLRPVLADPAQRSRTGAVAMVDTAFPHVDTWAAADGPVIGRELPSAAFSALTGYGSEGDELIAGHVAPPGRGDRHLRLDLGAGHYRTSARSLWRAGSGVHPGGGVHGGSAAIVAGLIRAEDEARHV
ncbi:MAG: FAD-dependent oxidoreductase [Microbacterium sp.]|uniref:phytoene desaturase family protein n=1 Tax=Microbacterium sp. TaxID=51671 RepID=UPI0039E4F1D4